LSRSITSVVGFPVCSLSTEYCEDMPEPSKCRQWLEKNFPDVYASMSVGEFHQTVSRSFFLSLFPIRKMGNNILEVSNNE
jgi:hypothetical protein